MSTTDPAATRSTESGTHSRRAAATVRTLAANVGVEDLGEIRSSTQAAQQPGRPHTLERLAAAQEHYRRCGYTDIAAPWLVSAAAHDATAPPDSAPQCLTIGGHLVASGEQSLLQLHIDAAAGHGEPPPARAQTTTACFRPEHDDWHQRHFWKLELIDTTDPGPETLAAMINAAAEFHEQHLDIAAIATPIGIDLVCARTNIEVGSYGIRSCTIAGTTHRWVYGTGCAEPRLTQLIAATRA